MQACKATCSHICLAAMQACALRGGSAAPLSEPAALPDDALQRLRRLAASLLCASAQYVWVALAFFMQQAFSLEHRPEEDGTGEPAAMAPAALMEAAKEEFRGGRAGQAHFLWRLAAVGHARSFEGPVAAREPGARVPAGRVQAMRIGAPAWRGSDDGNLLANLLSARARTRTYDNVRLPAQTVAMFGIVSHVSGSHDIARGQSRQGAACRCARWPQARGCSTS